MKSITMIHMQIHNTANEYNYCALKYGTFNNRIFNNFEYPQC